MFTIDQIKTAHKKVKSGVDFPAYIRNLKTIGICSYETFVSDGHTQYLGDDEYNLSSPAMYENLMIAEACNAGLFESALQAHQEGKTSYITFCNDCATSGINKWHVNIRKMTCTYFDKSGNEILMERIPQ